MSGVTNNGMTIQSWGGTSNVQDKAMSIEMRMQMVLLDSTQMQQTSMADQINDMDKRNQWVRDANAKLGELRANRPITADGVSNYGDSVMQFAKDNGISIDKQDGVGNQAEFDQGIANMKSAIDTASSSSQLDMVRLGSTQTKLGQAWDLLTNSNKKVADTMSNAIRG